MSGNTDLTFPPLRPFKILILLLLAAWGLRVILVLQGGQLYWPDEMRYFRSWKLLAYLSHGDLRGAVDSLMPDSHGHRGFIVLGCLPAIFQYTLIRFNDLPVNLISVEETSWVAAIFLSGASVICIGLIFAISRKMGANQKESLIAAFLMATTTSMFYYSRHLLPYDSSMAIALLSLWLGLDGRWNIWRSFFCGLLACLAFLTYNGYWLLTLIILIIHLLYGIPSRSDLIKRGSACGLGLIMPVALLTIMSHYWSASPFITGLMRFSETAVQGDFSEGWLLTWAYLWRSEHGLLILWGLGVGTFLGCFLKNGQSARDRGLLGVGAAVGIYLLLVLFSCVLEKMVVYGRLVRQMVPFLCLAAASGLHHILEKYWPKEKIWIVALFILIIVQAVINFYQPLVQRFPIDIQRQVRLTYGEVALDVSVQGPSLVSENSRREFLIQRQLTAMNRKGILDQSDQDFPVDSGNEKRRSTGYVLLNAQHLYPVLASKAPPQGKTVLAFAHPLQFFPYQYEGYTPRERSTLRSTDIAMRLIDTGTLHPENKPGSGDS